MSNREYELLDYIKETNYPLSQWALKKTDIEKFAYLNNAFTPDQCNAIIKIGRNLGLEEAKVGDVVTKDIDFRLSKISWIFPGQNTEWIFRALTDAVQVLNEQYFRFDLTAFSEGLQFTEYSSPGGMYSPHVDCGSSSVRKLSISVQLSDENDYDGGDVVCNYGYHGDVLPRTQGTVLAFPSYALHGVKPVTRGTRYSLVAWVTGPQFK